MAVTSDLPATGSTSVTVQKKGEPDLRPVRRAPRETWSSPRIISAAEIPLCVDAHCETITLGPRWLW